MSISFAIYFWFCGRPIFSSINSFVIIGYPLNNHKTPISVHFLTMKLDIQTQLFVIFYTALFKTGRLDYSRASGKIRPCSAIQMKHWSDFFYDFVTFIYWIFYIKILVSVSKRRFGIQYCEFKKIIKTHSRFNRFVTRAQFQRLKGLWNLVTYTDQTQSQTVYWSF